MQVEGKMASLELSLLGTFSVKYNGKPFHHFSSDKVRALLAYLAVESSQYHTREHLAELFWPERSPSFSNANLRNALSDLRRDLTTDQSDNPLIYIEKEGVQFNSASDCLVDVTFFEEQISIAQSIHTHSEDLPDAMAYYRSALSVYQGNFLEGFTLKDCPGFDDWSYFVGERLLYKASTALSRLASYHEGRCEYEQSISYALRRIELEPWLEAAHLQMIRLLALAGRRQDALEQYHQCCLMLQKELDVQPSAELTSLYVQIRDGKALVAHPEDPFKLPVYLTPFVGRQVELDEIEARFKNPDCRLITLAGPGGCGKTRLAVEAAGRLAPSFQDGVRFIPLVGLEQAQNIPSTFIQALGLSSTSADGARQSLLNYLHEKELLLVLDNFEQLIPGGVEIIEDLLQQAPRLRLLVTSRQRLRSMAEWLFMMDGLDLPGADPEDRVRDSASIQLFAQTAQRLRTRSLADEELPQVIRICRSVSGMPLAIEIAASWTRVLSCDEIAVEIERSLAFLERGGQLMPTRHNSVLAVFESTWKTLSPVEQDVFTRLSVFRGGFTYQAAGAVADASPHTLANLMDKCLVMRRPNGRNELHELLRQYAKELLGKDPEAQEKVQEKHGKYYLSLLTGVDVIWSTQEALALIDEEYPNFMTAWEWSLGKGQIQITDLATEKLYQYMSCKTRYSEMVQLISRFLKELPTNGNETLQAKHLAFLGTAFSTIGKYEAARECLEKSLSISSRLGLANQRAITLGGLANLYFRDDYPEGIRFYQESFAYLEKEGDLNTLSNRYLRQGLILAGKGLVTRSADSFARGIEIGRSIKNMRWVGYNLAWLGHARVVQGRLNEAGDCFREAAEILTALGLSRYGEAYRLGGLARISQWKGRLEDARALQDESLGIWDSLLKRGSEVYVNLGYCMFHRCEILDKLGRYTEMKQSAIQAMQIFQCHQTEIILETPRGIGWALYLLSRAQIGLQDFSAARETLQSAIRHFRNENYTDWILFCLAAWSELLVNEASTPECKSLALELLTLVLAHPRLQEIEYHSSGKGRADLGHDVAWLASDLTPAQALQARETGAALQFDNVVSEIISSTGRYYSTHDRRPDYT